METVWESELDHKYCVRVTRTLPYKGRLTITEEEKVLHEQDVGLSYDAIFGPDAADVDEWQNIAMKFVDQKAATVVAPT